MSFGRYKINVPSKRVHPIAIKCTYKGVVGIKKFQCDIWGDTVNLAARMEQSGVPGKINISQHTHELIKEQFTCVYRRKVEAKNKGDIDMYFVE